MKKNKTSKYLKYAIGEIILVVIGILLALQINNWNENRQNQNSLDRYTESLIKEIANDTIDYNHYIDLLLKRQKRISRYKILISKGNLTPEDLEKLLKDYGLLVISYNPVTTTYEDLVNTGNLELFSKSKREAISSHLRWIKYIEESIDKNEAIRTNQRMKSLEYLNQGLDTLDFFNSIDFKRDKSYIVQGLKHKWNEISKETDLLTFMNNSKEFYFDSAKKTIYALKAN
jgi:hypothetical protein